VAEKPEAIVGGGAVHVLQAGMPIYVKTADICAMTGKTNQWIGELTKQGILNKEATQNGSLYELRRNIRAYCEMLEARVKETDEEAERLDADKAKAETQIKQARAVIAIMEANELKGKMHRSEDVQAITEDLVYAIRSLLIALPGRLAVDVAEAEDAAETATIIRNEVHKLMEELSNYRYDPKRYEERVRERKSWEALEDDEEE
jgi:phage terminase Nu1 subunit (DNA packaging protein)